jgi:hypothetical protein
LIDLRREQNLSGISARPRNGALRTGADQVTLKRSLRMQTGETASPSAAHKMRAFGAVHGAAFT